MLYDQETGVTIICELDNGLFMDCIEFQRGYKEAEVNNLRTRLFHKMATRISCHFVRINELLVLNVTELNRRRLIT
jgi:hypothetical protein